MKQDNKLLFVSMLLGMNNGNEHEVTLEDLRYMRCPKVSECQFNMYMAVINLLNEGKSYEEIYAFIDNVDMEEYKKLTEEEQKYVKARIRKDLVSRRMNEQKNKGEI